MHLLSFYLLLNESNEHVKQLLF